jgi:hypothetical protein
MKQHWSARLCVLALGTRAPCLKALRLLLTLLLLLFIGITESAAQTIRGQVVFRNGTPAVGVPVRVFNPHLGPSGFAFTGYDGLFYLNGIPPGDYQLQVFFNQRAMPPMPVRVFAAPHTDVPRYFLPW